MKITQVMVEFEKRVNDGNYGSEHATVQYVALVDEGEDPDDVIRQLVARGREKVIVELGSSESLTVRRALNPPKRMCSECGQGLADDEDYYHPACDEVVRQRHQRELEEREERYRQQQIEWEARRKEHPELAAVGASEHDASDDDDDDDDEDEPDF